MEVIKVFEFDVVYKVFFVKTHKSLSGKFFNLSKFYNEGDNKCKLNV